MSEPIVFVSHQRIKEGQIEAYTQYYRQVAELTRANKPGTVAHLAYADEGGTAVTIVHVFPDAEAMGLHMHGVGELARKAFEMVEIVGIELYGRPGETILQSMRQIVGPGVTLNIKPQPLGGYLRLKPGGGPGTAAGATADE